MRLIGFALLGSGIAASLLPPLWLLQFTHPQADDLNRMAKAIDRGTLSSIATEYLQWTGRVLNVAFEYALFSQRDHYGVFLAAILIFYALSLGALLRAMRAPRWAWPTLLAFHWATHPNVGQNFFWLTGAIEYVLSLSFFFLLFATLIRPPRSPILAAAMPLLLGTAVGLSHELYAVAACLVIAAVIVERRSVPRAWVIAGVCVFVGTIVMALSPGNREHMTYFPHARDLARSAHLTFSQLGATFLAALASPLVWSLVAFFAALPAAPIISLRGLPFVALLVVAAAFFVTSYGMGEPMPTRALGGIGLLVTIAGVATILASRATFLRSPRALPLAAGVLGVLLMSAPNTRHAISDALGPAARYDRTMRARYAVARAPALIFSPIPSFPRTFFAGDLLANAKAPRNRSFAKLLGVESVFVPLCPRAE